MSLNIDHLRMRSAQDIHEAFRLLGYPSYEPQAFEGAALDEFELDPSDRANVNRAYVVASLGNHTVYLFEVNSLNQVHLRSLAWNVLQRGTGLLIVTRDYREIRFVDPRLVGKFNKSNVRVNKLNLLVTDPTRHDVDTLNSIHAHRRTAQQVYDAQAQAFNITSITKKFYEEYRRHYERARAVIRQYNKGIREFQNTDETDKLHAFTQRLLGRLMFLYFLQRKGWLGGKYKFLTEQYTAIQRAHDGETTADAETFYYYTEVLEPLFYETLNTKRLDNLTRWQGLRIPYLNGGLFDRERDPQGIIILPDSLFDPNSPEGVLAFFNRYNFTIADDTPLEQDVAVDPEMLGKVFENMLEERDRGQSGSFYTPRTIVSYMCQEALVGYLEESAHVPREITRAQFDPDNTARFEREQLPAITAALDTLTVLDPAVGSGSFLIGMMNEIIRLRKACHVVQAPSEAIKPETVAQWKASIIRDTLYGVDIKPEAIEIAQLRLWLALVVEQTLEQAHPLPNLDYKLMAGNSLIETIDGEPILTENARAMIGKHAKPEQLTLIGGATDNERFKLDELRQRFFTATPAERTHLRADIEAQERRIVATSLRERADIREKNIAQLARRSAQMKGILSKAEQNKMNAAVTALDHLTALQDEMNKPTYTPPFFIYRLKFSEVFERKGGFDIVVVNPPYVRGEKIGAQKEELKASVLYQDVYNGSADLYVYFYKRAYEVLKPRGQLAFITTNKFIKARYGAGLKKFLVNNMTLHELIDFGDLPIFKEAI
ncbi:MAG: Eco57I restriction-modification methylase domain-containing protein, partial [Phototrophicaceae bacterium]